MPGSSKSSTLCEAAAADSTESELPVEGAEERERWAYMEEGVGRGGWTRPRWD